MQRTGRNAKRPSSPSNESKSAGLNLTESQRGHTRRIHNTRDSWQSRHNHPAVFEPDPLGPGSSAQCRRETSRRFRARPCGTMTTLVAQKSGMPFHRRALFGVCVVRESVGSAKLAQRKLVFHISLLDDAHVGSSRPVAYLKDTPLEPSLECYRREGEN